MKKYHKIKTVFKRDPENNFKTLLEGEYSLPEFEYLANDEWVYTEKVNGTNIRVMFETDTEDQLSFAGKNNNSQIPTFLSAKLGKEFLPKLDLFKDTFDRSVCLYGEGHGAKIQNGGGNYRKDQGFVLFDIKIDNWWLKRNDIETIAKGLGIEIVPIIGVGTLPEMVGIVKSGLKSTWGDFQAEGIVARPTVELATRSGQRVITKLKYNDFIT